MRRLLLCTALLAASCATPAARSPEPGEWTGDVEVPQLRRPIAVLVRVPADTGAWQLVGLQAHGLSGTPLQDVRTGGGVLEFTWPQRQPRHCRLTRAAQGSYAGECTAAGEDGWRMLLQPPSRRGEPMGLARSARAHADFTWQTHTDDVVRVHGIEGVDLPQLAARARAAITSHLRLLGEGGYDRPIDIFAVDTRGQVNALAGMHVRGFADPLGSAVVVSGFGTQEKALRHELMHVLSVQQWGEPSTPWGWLLEGMATYAAGGCAGRSLHELAAYMRTQRMLLPVRTLIDDFHRHNDLVTYLQSGSFFGYLLETHDRALARAVWQQGLDAALRDAGLDAATEEQRWLAGLPEPADVADWTRILDNGCG